MTREPLALVGIGCRFPGGNDAPDRLFQNLLAGQDAIAELPADRWDPLGFYDRRTGAPGKMRTRWAGLLNDVFGFDAELFGISPREAVAMDPQQRLLLEVAWESLEDAGATGLDGSRTGVFVGIASDDYVRALSLPLNRHRIDGYTNSGGALSIAANRISYCFNLKGPSLAVDTACSSSLVALHLACQSLWQGECERALVGGVTVHLLPESTIGFSAAQMLAPDGRCRSFSADGQGFVRAEGCGVVVLKPLARAVADDDRVYAVVLGTGVNQDGATDGITMPSESAQAALLVESYAKAGLDVRDVQYVEAHGTGTPVGDPIEARALGRVLGAGRPKDRPLLIGSVKSNLGHLEAGSGIAGVIKTALCIHRGTLTGNLHFARPNPNIDFEALRLKVPTKAQPWPSGRKVAGVNSFGFGGTNAHAVLAEPPAAAPRRPESPKAPWLLGVSAPTDTALGGLVEAYGRLVEQAPLADVAWSAGTRRVHHARRVAVVAVDGPSAAKALKASSSAPRVGRVKRLAFVFTGQGPQWHAMGRQLFDLEPVYRAALERADAALAPHLGFSIVEELGRPEEQSRVATQTLYAQPGIFALQIGLLALFESWGIEPFAAVGHSVGEVAAGYAAGAYGLDDAARIIAARARLQQQVAHGRMVALGLDLEAARALAAAHEGVDVAVHNGPSATVLAGDAGAIEAIARTQQQQGTFARLIEVRGAFHSRHMDPIRAGLEQALASVRARPPQKLWVSTVTAEPLRDDGLSGGYWWRNVREPVRFADAFRRLLELGCDGAVELGPHPALVAGMRDLAGGKALVLPSLDKKQPERAALLATAGALYQAGAPLAWANVNAPAGRVELPRTPWNHRTFNGEGEATRAERTERATHPLLGRRPVPGADLWQAQLDRRLVAWLDEHQVHGTTVVPGAALLDVAVAAGRRQELSAVVLERVRIERALTLAPEQSLTLQTQVDDDQRFTLCSGDAKAPHARGWVRPWKGAVVPPVDVAGLKARLAPFSPAELYQQVARAGLSYGPAFRCVTACWASDGESLGELRLPASLEADAALYVIHPGLLDSAFQSMLAATPAFSGSVYLPQRVERFTVTAGALPSCLLAHTRVRSASEVAVTVDLTLAAEDGTPVAWLEGFRMVALREARAGADELLYGVDWVARPLLPVHEPPPRLPAPKLAPTVGEQQLLERFCPRFDALTLQVARHALSQLVPGSSLSRAALTAKVHEGQRRYLDGLLALLESKGELEVSGDLLRWSRPGHAPAALVGALTAEFGPTRDVELLVHVDEVLPRVLSGALDPVAALFEGAGAEVLARFYREGVLARRYNAQLADAVVRAAEGLPAGRRLRVLEVGAGTGSATQAVLSRLEDGQLHYCFSDLSPAFFAEVQAEHAHRACLDFRVFDLDRAPAQQGLAPASFDVVIASNVVHAAADLAVSLGHLHEVLAPGGQLVLLETRDFPLGAVVFAMFKGWTRDFPDGRRGTPLVEPGRWRELLERAGFEVAVAGAGQTRFVERPATLAVATRRASAPAARRAGWLVLAEPGAEPCARALLGELSSAGAPSELSLGSLEALGARLGTAAQTVLLLGPGGEPAPAARTVALTRLAAAWARRHDERAGRRLVLWAAGIEGASMGGLFNAGLKGVVRSLAAEALGLAVRLVDGDEAASPVESAHALAAELLGPDDEPEVRYHRGARWARRLQRLAGEAGEWLAPLSQARRRPCRLEITEPGLVENLRLRPAVRRAPGPFEVEVEVRACAINFNDAMFAQGLLNPEDNEPDFKGGALGRECTGVVTRVGEKVKGLAPNDRVWGAMIASMGHYATFPEEMVRRLPDALGFEEAVTLPLVAVTVERALGDLAGLTKGESVLIHGGAGGVGLAAIQFAQRVGATIFATAGTPEKREYLKGLGVAHALDSRSLAFADEVLRLTGGRGVDVVLNSLAGDGLRRSLDATADFGRFVEIGRRDMDLDTRLGMAPLLRGISLLPVELKHDIHKRPELRRALFDRVAALMESGAYRPLPHKRFRLSEAQQAFKWMLMSKQIGKVVMTVDGAEASEPAVDAGTLFRRDATYLVTGGTRGFGLAVAEWLAQHGAGQLVLVSRHGVPADGEPALRRLRATGARVQVVKADLGDARAVEALVRELERGPRPLKGVFHAAMTLADVPLSAMTEEQARAVIAPKVGGAWQLHELTEHLELDHFVLFSSIMGFFGNHGQAAYAAANTFLDALAAHRRARGKPGLSVAWTHVTDVGYVAERSAVRDLVSRRFGRGVTPREAGALLTNLLQRDVAYALAGPIQWSRVFSTNESYARARVLERFSKERAGEADPHGHLDLSTLSEADRRARVMELLAVELKKVTGVDQLPEDQPITHLGLDSLMAVELRGRLMKRLDVDVPTLELLRGPTLEELADLVSVRLGGAARPDGAKVAVSSWVRRRPVKAPRVRLLCVPGFAETLTAFDGWQAALPEDVELWTLGFNEAAESLGVVDLGAVAKAMAQELAPSLDGPYALFGNSMGSLVAFELAEQLAGLGRPPKRVFVRAFGPEVFSRVGARLIAEAEQAQAQDVPRYAEFLGMSEAVKAELASSPEALELLRRRLVQQLRMGKGHSVGERRLDAPLCALRAEHDESISAEDVGRWREHAPEGAFELLVQPGASHHFTRAEGDGVLEAVLARLG